MCVSYKDESKEKKRKGFKEKFGVKKNQWCLSFYVLKGEFGLKDILIMCLKFAMFIFHDKDNDVFQI